MNSNLFDFDKGARFDDLVEAVQHCDLCVRLCSKRKVLSHSNGTLNAKVLFVAEAPGRLGADRTGIPLHGDRTGDNFETLLKNIGWRREDIFITNAVLCNPMNENGNNGTPTAVEIANCAAYLEMVIALIKPDIIASLGITALSALGILSPHGIELREGVATPTLWRGALLFPLYHPGPRALIHRSLSKQRADFMRLAKLVDPIRGLKEQRKRKALAPGLFQAPTTGLHQVIRALLELGGQMSYFRLMKLLYFVDFFAIKNLGRMVACDRYFRQAEGPWSPELDKALEAMQGHEVRRWFERRSPMVAPGPAPRSDLQLDDAIAALISEVIASYGQMDNSRIKTAAYLTDPMRFILKKERQGQKMSNAMVLYKGKTARELDKH